ncbi:MAG: glycosyltransferase [Cyanobacteria bacterium P01_G01_bin.67]
MNKITIIHPQAGVNWKDNSAIFAIELARHLDNHLEVELLSGAECGSFSRPLKAISHNDDDRLLTSSLLSKCWNRPQVALKHWTSYLSCLTYLLKNPTDLIISQNGYGSLLIASLLREITGTPILHTQHQNRLNLEKCLQRNLKLRPERLISLNPFVTDYIRRLEPQQSVNTIPYGVDLTEFCPVGKTITTGLSQPCIMTVAPLNRDRHHRIELTIKAVSSLPDASLLICGEGADSEYYQELGDRLLGSERFQIKSFAFAQMPQVYRSANIFTCAAAQESGSMKYIEAMACGLPVVATDDAVRRYLIGNGGITCDVTNIDSYTQSLQDIWSKHQSWHQPRQNAVRFSWQGITLMYYRAIMKTINDSNSQFTPLPTPQSMEG